MNERIDQILAEHRYWLVSAGWQGHQAMLSGQNLAEENLAHVDLSRADLAHTDLSHADLSWSNLCGADLRDADLRGAVLRFANLAHSNLRGAVLTGADLSDAVLAGAELAGAYDVPDAARLQTQIVPEEGAFRGFKKLLDGYVAILDIPEAAQRSNGTGRLCRASEAFVARIYHPDRPGIDFPDGQSERIRSFMYIVGQTVRPEEGFDTDRWNEFSSGIHFFMTRREAEEY